jgi:ABC-type bacteriocin/lantibiotic exporter with double-glycine peptidase domain
VKQIRTFLGPDLASLGVGFRHCLLAAVVMFSLDTDLAALALWPLPLIVATAVLYQRAAVPRLRPPSHLIGLKSP